MGIVQDSFDLMIRILRAGQKFFYVELFYELCYFNIVRFKHHICV